jgi:endonuclease YncB( thermonuclease family)
LGVVVQFQRWRRNRAWTMPQPGRKAGRLLLPAVILSAAAIGYFSYGMGELRLGWSGALSQCLMAGQPHCVIDGDTIRYDGMTIRLAGIDAPEIRDFKCPSERALGQRATRRLLELMNAGPFTVVETGGRDVDVYGRKLRHIMRDEQSLGDILIAEGLARRWDGARRSWCG